MSWELQETAVRALAGRYGVDDLELQWDWGRSGGEGKRHLRAGWIELHRRIEAGEVQLVFGYAADRMARSLLDLLTFYRACDSAGVKVVYHDGGEQDFRTPEGKLRLQVMGGIAEFQRAQTVEKAKAMHRIRRERGERVGRAPYGSQPGDQVGAVVAAYREAGSISGTATRLNARSIPSAMGRTWSPSAVRLVLDREAPELLPRVMRQGARPVSAVGFVLYHLLRCPCGRLLTANRPSVGDVLYRCQLAETDPHHSRPYRVREQLLLPWVKAEVGRLRVPAAVELDGDQSRRPVLEGKRARWVEMYAEGVIDKAIRDTKLSAIDEELDQLADEHAIVTVPAIDWTAEPKGINAYLRAIFREVTLDAAMHPVGAIWNAPSLRAE